MDDENKPIICVDLDSLLSGDFFHPAREGAREFLAELDRKGYRVVIFTGQWGPHVESWLARNELSEHVWMVTDKKPAALAYIDHGDYAKVLEQLQPFQA